MSHLLKKNKKTLYFLRYFFLLLIISMILSTLFFYDGNKVILAVYAILINFILCLGFYKNSTFFELFFGSLLWLGFWFKFFVLIVIYNIIYDANKFYEGFSESFLNLSDTDKFEIIDKSLITSCFAFVAYILASFSVKFLVTPKKNILNYEDEFFIKFQNFFIIIFIFTVILIAFFNLDNLIYQRGMISQSTYPFYINGIIKWSLLFGLSSIISILIFYNLKNKKLLYFLSFLSIFEASISNFSYLSRASIFNTFAIFVGVYKSNKFFKLNFNFKYFMVYILSIIFFFVVTTFAVNFYRTYYYYSEVHHAKKDVSINFEMEKKGFQFKVKSKVISDKYNDLNKAILELMSLFGNRWVGIDAVISVENHRNKNFDLFYGSFFEKYDSKNLPYYERKIKEMNANLNPVTYGIKTPGIVSFLYFTGSKLFLFFLFYLIVLIFILLEKYLLKILLNPIFCSLIMQVIAYRLIHFGYLPAQSYLLFGSIFLTILIHLFLNKVFKKKFKN